MYNLFSGCAYTCYNMFPLSLSFSELRVHLGSEPPHSCKGREVRLSWAAGAAAVGNFRNKLLPTCFQHMSMSMMRQLGCAPARRPLRRVRSAPARRMHSNLAVQHPKHHQRSSPRRPRWLSRTWPPAPARVGPSWDTSSSNTKPSRPDRWS